MKIMTKSLSVLLHEFSQNYQYLTCQLSTIVFRNNNLLGSLASELVGGCDLNNLTDMEKGSFGRNH